MTSSHGRLPRGPRMRPIDLTWVSVAILLPAMAQLRTPMGTIDLAYQVRVGNWILDTGSIPQRNTYSFAGGRWVDQQWGAQVVIAVTHRLGSWSALLMLSAVLVGVSSWLLYLACRAAGAGCRNAALLTFAGILVAGPSLAMRPQLFAVPLFACTLWLLASRTRHTRRLWALPVLAVACAQLHGSFVLLPVLVGLACLEDWRAGSSMARRMAVFTVLTGAATLISPHGLTAWTDAFALSSSSKDLIRTQVREWQPADLGSFSGGLVVVSGMVVALLCARRTTKVAWGSLVRLGFFYLLAMSAVRAGLWWAFVATVEVAALTAHDRAKVRETDGPRESMAPAMAIIGALTIFVIASLPWWKESEEQFLIAPTALSDAVVSNLPPGSRLLVEQGWGSWFEFAVPTMPVFMDSLLPEAAQRDYIDFHSARANWREIPSRWHVDAIVAAQHWAVLPYLRSDPDWRVAFENDEGVVFVRSSAARP